MKTLALSMPMLMILFTTQALAQEAWTHCPVQIDYPISQFQAVSSDECIFVSNETETVVARVDAMSWSSTQLLRTMRSNTTPLMHWLSRDTGVVTTQEHTPSIVHVYWTLNGGGTWDSLSFVPSGTIYTTQITPWGCVYISIVRGAIATVDTRVRRWSERTTGIPEFRHLYFFDSLKAVGINWQGFMGSSDGGVSWERTLQGGTGLERDAFHVGRDGSIFARVGSDFQRSLDSGVTWQALSEDRWHTDLVLDAVDASSIWCTAYQKVGAEQLNWGTQCFVVQREEGVWDRLHDMAWSDPYATRLSMWDETHGWTVGTPVGSSAYGLFYTSTGGVTSRGITVADFSTLDRPRVRIMHAHGRLGPWQSAVLKRRRAGAMDWDWSRPIPHPVHVLWDEDLEAGVHYEYSVTAEYPDRTSSYLLSEAIATGTPSRIDVFAYLGPDTNSIATYWSAFSLYGNGTEHDTVGIIWTHETDAEDEHFILRCMREDRDGTRSGRKSTHAFWAASKEEVPVISLMNSCVRYQELERFARIDTTLYLTHPDTLCRRLSINPRERPGIDHDYVYVRGVGLVKGDTEVRPLYGGVTYRIRLTDLITGAHEPEHPVAFGIHAVYPNPLNTFGFVDATFGQPSNVTVAVYNARGVRVATVFSGCIEAGRRAFSFDRGLLPRGVYWLAITSGSGTLVRPFTIL